MPRYLVELREIVSLQVEVDAPNKREAYRTAVGGDWLWQSEAGQEILRRWSARGSASEITADESFAPEVLP